MNIDDSFLQKWRDMSTSHIYAMRCINLFMIVLVETSESRILAQTYEGPRTIVGKDPPSQL